jgi:hypothetical protein
MTVHSGFPASIRPSSLLAPNDDIVPLVGHRDVVSRLADWAGDVSSGLVRAIVGPGGAGKTRVATEVLKEVQCRAHLVDPDFYDQVVGVIDDRHRDDMLCLFDPFGSGRRLIIIDNAETYRDEVHRIIRRALDEPYGSAKVMLTVRHPEKPTMGWLSSLMSGADEAVRRELDDASKAEHLVELQPLNSVVMLNELAHVAYGAFKRRLNLGGPDKVFNETFVNPLDAVAAAVDELIGSGLGSGDGALDRVIEAEEAYWLRTLASIPALARVGLDEARVAIAVTSLVEYQQPVEVIGLLRTLEEFRDKPSDEVKSVARLIKALYGVSGLRPNRMAETVIHRVLCDEFNVNLRAEVLTGNLASARTFVVLSRLAHTYQPEWLNKLVNENLRTIIDQLGPDWVPQRVSAVAQLVVALSGRLSPVTLAEVRETSLGDGNLHLAILSSEIDCWRTMPDSSTELRVV